MQIRRILVQALFISAFLSPAPAQTVRYPFVEGGKAQIPPGPVPWILVPCDVDRDGDLDLLSFTDVAYSGGLCHILKNAGKGRFTWEYGAFTGTNNLGGCPRRIFTGDLDGDGDLDLVLGSPLVLFNDGKGNFRANPKSLPSMAPGTKIAAMGDVDRDGDLDLLAVRAGYPLKSFLLLNDGRGRFSLSGALAPPPAGGGQTRFPISLFLDVDGDGDLDYVGVDQSSGLQGWTLRVSWNSGKGNFKGTIPVSTGVPPSSVRRLAAGDVNGDGSPDLFLSPASRIFLNDGKGKFRDASGTHLAAPVPGDDAVFADFDGDGDLDLVSGSGEGLFYAENKGKGFFRTPRRIETPAGGKYTGYISTGDFDGDGDRDVVFAGGGRPILLLNDGKARFTAASGAPFRKFSFYPGYLASSRETRYALGDVDGDGDPDLVGDGPGKRFLLLLNDGSGNFSEAPASKMPPKPVSSPLFYYRVYLADVNGDGTLDLLGLCANYGGSDKNVLYLNTGKGTFKDFSALNFKSGPFKIRNTSIAIGDFDKDGDPDLILGNDSGGDVYLVNQGFGIFRRAGTGFLPQAAVKTRGLAKGDLDGDGDLDLLRIGPGGNGKYLVQVLWNDGKGRFKAGAPFFSSTGLSNCRRPLLADLDGDGDLDLVVGLLKNGKIPPVAGLVFLNPGNGLFPPTPSSPALPGFPEQCLDLDGDGDRDLVLSGALPTHPYLFSILAAWNDGKGRFSKATPLDPALFTNGLSKTYKVLEGDLDGEGSPDLVVFSLYPFLSPQVLFNSFRYLRAPWACSIGKEYRLEIFGGPSQAALLFMGLKPGKAVLPPFGVLRVDPSLILPLFPIAVFRGPKAWWQGKVPKDPVLLGKDLFFQALVLDVFAPRRTRFTGLVRDRVGAW